MASLDVRAERWPIAGAFVISRGAKTEAQVIVVEIADAGFVGRGECTPYGRYGETCAGVLEQIEAVRSAVEAGLDRAALQGLLAAGAARNAIDCALWDLDAKRSGRRAFELAGLARLDPVKTAYTLSLAAPEAMAQQARANARRPMLKLKIGGADDLDRVKAVREAAPRSRLIVDANEGLDFDALARLAPELKQLGVMLVEQPLKAGQDQALEGYDSPVRLCADESLHTRAELEACARRYACVNVKLDKTGGLTEALALARDARGLGMQVMVGCMAGTSLAMAPGMVVGQLAEFVDLDGPLLHAEDRDHGIEYDRGLMQLPSAALWG
jgi:L-alanine-DL-glutamate epimerase-like enolase superfamily enzyme